MDISKVMVVFLTHLISLDFNLAESKDSDATLQDVAASDVITTPYIPARFAWAFSKESPKTTSASKRRGRASAETDDEDVDDPQARVVYWIPTTCDSLSERGYTCVGCGESLHCMGGNFALKAICYGRRPYCRNGVCSYIPGEKCQKEGQETHVADPAVQPGHETHIADPAMQPAGQVTHTADQAMQSDILPANATLLADAEENKPSKIPKGAIDN